MTSTGAVAFDVEQGLIELPGTPPRWIWAFTCPTPKCACRAAIVLQYRWSQMPVCRSVRGWGCRPT